MSDMQAVKAFVVFSQLTIDGPKTVDCVLFHEDQTRNYCEDKNSDSSGIHFYEETTVRIWHSNDVWDGPKK